MSELKKKVRVSNKIVALDGEQMCLRLLAANARKKVPLQWVMSFENAQVPLSSVKIGPWLWLISHISFTCWRHWFPENKSKTLINVMQSLLMEMLPSICYRYQMTVNPHCKTWQMTLHSILKGNTKKSVLMILRVRYMLYSTGTWIEASKVWPWQERLSEKAPC